MSESIAPPATQVRRLSRGKEDMLDKNVVSNFTNNHFKTKVNLASVGSDEPIIKSVQIDFPSKESEADNNKAAEPERRGRPSIVDEFLIKNLKIDSNNNNPVSRRIYFRIISSKT